MTDNDITDYLIRGHTLVNMAVYGLMERAQREVIQHSYSEKSLETAIRLLNRAYSQRPGIETQYAITTLTNQYTAKLHSQQKAAEIKPDE